MAAVHVEAVGPAVVRGDVDLPVVAQELVLPLDDQDKAAVVARDQAAALRDHCVCGWRGVG